jgi:hypothetical protein
VVHTLPSLQLGAVPAVHVPVWQVSAPLQALPSVHEVPLATLVFWQPVAGTHESLVHALPSLQLGAVPAVHAPLWQVSTPLQALPSVQVVPFATTTFWQPEAGTQESVVHGFESLQLGGVPAAQAPAWQVSAPLQVSPSLHGLPLATAVWRQPPAPSQVSVVQGLLSLQSRPPPGAHTPAWQSSSPLQALPSGHGVPFGTAVFWQPVAGTQVSVVHTLASLQLGGVPAAQAPAWQVSAPLHRSPSLHGVPLTTAVFWQPVAGTQVSVVHTLASLQLGAVPAVQLPA